MNILYLHCHDLGRYIQPHGYAIPAPNVQRLAEQGVLFRQAFAAAPTCSPSRAALVTGQWPHCCGMFGLASEKWGFTPNDYRHHIAAYLKARGYETALSGVQHVARLPWHNPRDMGYDHLLNHVPTKLENHQPDRTASAAVEFLRRKHERPFFLSVGFLEPHRFNRGDRRVFSQEIGTEPADIDDRYCLPMPHQPDMPVTRREMANFKQAVEVVDSKMGAVLDALADSGLSDETLVICTTDHGPGFPDMKCTLTDRGTGVMLIMRAPRGLSGGRVLDALVSQMDICPTICELLGIDKPDWLQGRSIMPLIAGAADEINDAIFTEQNYHGAYRPLRAVRTRRHKYIRRYDLAARKGVDTGPSERMWREHGWDDIPQGEEELYDLIFDPHEACNLAASPAHAPALEEMRSRLQHWLETTNDPILTDSVPQPPAWGNTDRQN
ncbi:MAG: sulfatase family protein [Planctomycetota bacterium]|jgi:arylsulfatase A-like enzyme